jgi:hypothetical protein
MRHLVTAAYKHVIVQEPVIGCVGSFEQARLSVSSRSKQDHGGAEGV